MKILANENFPLKSVLLLQQTGLDVLAVGTDYQGISDEEVITIANKENRTIITFDRDYGELIFKHGYRPKGGVIYLRLHDFKPEDPGEYLLKIFETKDLGFEHKLTVIDETKIRQRTY